MDRKSIVEKIREFNRYYMNVLSLLDKSYLNSEYSVTEARILYELQENKNCTANILTQKLHIDKSYMSRILHKFEDKGILKRKASAEDTRKYVLNLTQKGIHVTNMLIKLSNEQIGSIIRELSDKDCEEICRSMEKITAVMRKER